MRISPRALAAALGLLGLAGCAALEPRAERAAALAEPQGWRRREVAAGGFSLLAYDSPVVAGAAELTVYIEGDGLAWLDRRHVSPDPTPRRPLALELALAQGGGNRVWLARPCQYLADAALAQCSPAYWTARRSAPEVVEAMDAAVAQAKRRFGAQRLVLVGYSGGGALAALVAARRDDVARLVTVAADLDYGAWTAHHGVSPLDGSLDPAAVAAAVQGIPQLHLVGGRDEVVPPAIVQAFVARMSDSGRVRVTVVPAADHECCWTDGWAARLAAP